MCGFVYVWVCVCVGLCRSLLRSVTRQVLLELKPALIELQF